MLLSGIVSIILSAIAFVSSFFSFWPDIIIITAAIIFVTIFTKMQFDIVTPTIIISYVINYTFYLFSGSLAEAAALAVCKSAHCIKSVPISVCPLFVQMIFAYIPFKFKRLKNGLTFLQKSENSGAGLLISALIVFIISIIKTNLVNKFNYVFLIFGTVICIFGIIFWWRNGLKKLYIYKNTNRKIDDLNKTIAEKDAQINGLKSENERLSSLVHRDNKIIPAMGMTVRQYISQLNQKYPDDVGPEGDAIVRQLDDVMQDRYKAVIKAKNLSKVLPDVHIDSINGIFQYMYLRAVQHAIDYDVIVLCSVKYLIENTISELELSTVLSDLIENAIIAAGSSNYKKIVITIAVNHDAYEIDIQDSGALFESKILENIGRQRITSHAESGGSGIGLKTLFDILNKCHASLIITEYPQRPSSITKSIKIRFDMKNEFIIDTFRADELKKSVTREDVKVVQAIS